MRNICYLQDVRSDGPPHSYPIGGLCYYLTPPRTSLQVIQDPIYVVVYTLFTIRSCALFSRIWIIFFKRTAVDVATILRDKKMVMVGHGEETMLIELDRYISIYGNCFKRSMSRRSLRFSRFSRRVWEWNRSHTGCNHYVQKRWALL